MGHQGSSGGSSSPALVTLPLSCATLHTYVFMYVTQRNGHALSCALVKGTDGPLIDLLDAAVEAVCTYDQFIEARAS
jgi:hypothetical protein